MWTSGTGGSTSTVNANYVNLGYLQLGSENIAHERHRTGQAFLWLPGLPPLPPHTEFSALGGVTCSFDQPNFEPTVRSAQGPRELLRL